MLWRSDLPTKSANFVIVDSRLRVLAVAWFTRAADLSEQDR